MGDHFFICSCAHLVNFSKIVIFLLSDVFKFNVYLYYEMCFCLTNYSVIARTLKIVECQFAQEMCLSVKSVGC